MQLIDLTQNTNPLDHTTVTLEFTIREVEYLRRLIGATGGDVTEELEIFGQNPNHAGDIFHFLGEVIEESQVDIDEWDGGRLTFKPVMRATAHRLDEDLA